MCKCFSYFSQNPAPSLLSSKQIFPVLPEWRSCPGARGRLLPFQRLVPVATLPGHILSSKGIIIFSTLVLQKHHFSDCLNHPKNEQKCPTGDLAPIPRDSCCPSKAECDNKNCSQVIERTSYFSFFQGHFSCSSSLCQNVCFRTGALYCRTVRWRFDSSGSRGSVLSEQKSLPCPGACIIGFNDLKTINDFKTSWCALCRHFLWSQVIAGGQIAPRLPATWQGG